MKPHFSESGSLLLGEILDAKSSKNNNNHTHKNPNENKTQDWKSSWESMVIHPSHHKDGAALPKSYLPDGHLVCS